MIWFPNKTTRETCSWKTKDVPSVLRFLRWVGTTSFWRGVQSSHQLARFPACDGESICDEGTGTACIDATFHKKKSASDQESNPPSVRWLLSRNSTVWRGMATTDYNTHQRMIGNDVEEHAFFLYFIVFCIFLKKKNIVFMLKSMITFWRYLFIGPITIQLSTFFLQPLTGKKNRPSLRLILVVFRFLTITKEKKQTTK